jgi:broad specificity phosphatase PhoE
MSILFFVRHGQASFMHNNYDQLSPLGEIQAQALGNHWAALGLKFDRVYIGPRQRHQQTQLAVASVYQARGLSWPEPECLPELDEHQGFEVMKQVASDLAGQEPVIGELVRALAETEDVEPRLYLKALRRVMRLWARGEIKAEGLEDWPAFRARVQVGLEKIRAANSTGKTIVAFTSGGPIGTTTGKALNLTDEKILELAWAVRNAAYAEFLFSGARFSLITFNAASHMYRPELLTYV